MNKDEFLSYLRTREIECSDAQYESLINFMNDTLATNEKFNLTAIKDPDSFMEKMLLDSAIALYNLDLDGKKVIDIGTGAGFPGVVLKLLQPTSDITLLDSTKKKIDRLNEYSIKNDLGLNCVTSRAEDFARQNRETFDYAFARAVASLPVLLELIVPLLKVNGVFVALKGPGAEQEIIEASNAMKKLDCRLEKIYIDKLPVSNECRTLIYIIKEKKTQKRYPRDYKDIKIASL